ncbi:MAG: GNAT family N-acetyltransferase [Proteobacteria bacterium]|nr:GNAT family N-acetyltransferase [Pseudomonadota bacterium]
MSPRSSTLTIPNDVALVPVVTGFVREVAAVCGFDEADRHKIALCVEEAAANVIDHAFSADEDATYAVVCTTRTTGLEIAVRDMGLPFDPERIRPYDPNASLEERGDRGLGIFLMRRLMDHVTFRNLGKNGKETVLFRFFPGLHIEQMESDHDLSPWPAPKAEVARRENATFSLRLMRAEEAVEVSRAVYRAYGYSYVYENIYFPDRIRALNASGEMTSALALSDADGTLAGHVALFSSPASRSLVEIGMAVVKPEFRGYGLSNRLFAFLLDEARSRGFDGVFAHCVTNHELTQRVCLKLGFVDCALQVGFAPSTLSFKGITDVLAQRESVVVSHLTLSKPPPATLFSPPHHAEMLTRMT